MTVVIVEALVYITPVPAAVVTLDKAVVAPTFLRFRLPEPVLKLMPCAPATKPSIAPVNITGALSVLNAATDPDVTPIVTTPVKV